MSEPALLNIVIDTDTAGTTVLRLAGDLDHCTAEQLCDAVDQRLSHHPAQVCIDLADVVFLDAAGVRALLRCHAGAGRACCRIRLVNPRPLVHQILQFFDLVSTFGMAAPPVPAWRRPDPGRRGGPPPPTSVAASIAGARAAVAEACVTERHARTVCADTGRLLGRGGR